MRAYYRETEHPYFVYFTAAEVAQIQAEAAQLDAVTFPGLSGLFMNLNAISVGPEGAAEGASA